MELNEEIKKLEDFIKSYPGPSVYFGDSEVANDSVEQENKVNYQLLADAEARLSLLKKKLSEEGYNENMYLITQIQKYMNEEEMKREHDKNSFWPSETETSLFDIYHKWIGTPPTNPIEAEKLMVFTAGKMIEESLVGTLTKMGIVKEMGKDEQARVEMTREGIPVTGYIDAVFTSGNPLEVKSFYGDYQLRELRAGKPRESYLKQLAIYMDFLGADKGKLVYIERGTGEMFEFTLEKGAGLQFKCMNVEFDLTDTYQKWSRLYHDHIIPKIEPTPEHKYKYDIASMDWNKVSKADISKARNGHKVIGDWQVLYSPYKNLIIEREGTHLGYNDKEMELIKSLTKGYSSKK